MPLLYRTFSLLFGRTLGAFSFGAIRRHFGSLAFIAVGTNGASDGVFKGVFKRGSLTLVRDHHIIYSFLGIALYFWNPDTLVLCIPETSLTSHLTGKIPPWLFPPGVSGDASPSF